MQIYLVGGAVRDKLLGLPVKERDWVVVGATRQDMLDLGYKQVGRDFPVFLHPKTQEEYVLARTERKKGHGYGGFEVHADPGVSLEEDLLRRDLTINAIAEDRHGKLIDPFNGKKDLTEKTLKHVSKAFEEDPLRVLRLARFAAKLPGFKIHTETLDLCRNITQNGELQYLTPERIWQEWVKVCHTKKPGIFIDILTKVRAWSVIMPHCARPEIDIENLNKLAVKLQGEILFTVIGLYLEQEKYENYLQSQAIPTKTRDLARLVYMLYDKYGSFRGGSDAINQLLQKTDALRRSDRFRQALEVVQYTNPNTSEEPQMIERWMNLVNLLQEVRPDKQWLQDKAIQINTALQAKRKSVIEDWQKTL